MAHRNVESLKMEGEYTQNLFLFNSGDEGDGKALFFKDKAGLGRYMHLDNLLTSGRLQTEFWWAVWRGWGRKQNESNQRLSIKWGSEWSFQSKQSENCMCQPWYNKSRKTVWLQAHTHSYGWNSVSLTYKTLSGKVNL